MPRDPSDLIARIVERLATAHLDAAHAAVGLDMAWTLADLPGAPLSRGAPGSWGAAIVYVVAWLNGATGPDGARHVTLEALARDARVTRAAIHERVGEIRWLLDIRPDDPDWRVEPGLADSIARLETLATDPTVPKHAVELAMLLASLPPELQDRLEAALDASPDDPLGAIEPELDRMLRTTDTALLAQLDGLTLVEVERLATVPWEDPASLLTVAEDTPLAALADAALLHDVRHLLALVRDGGPIRATQAGNLPRTAVAAFLAVRPLSHDAPFDHAPIPGWEIRDEADCFPLRRARVVAERAGLIALERGRFQLTVDGVDLLDEARAGALHARLVRTVFQRTDLTEFDRHEAPLAVQFSAAWAMRWLLRHPVEWRTPGAWIEALLVAPLRATLPPVRHETYDVTAHALELRVLRWLVILGLAEMAPVDAAEAPPFRRYRYARAPLLERVVTVRC